MATPPSSQGDPPRPSHHSKTFHQLVSNQACACGRPECRGVLRDYYLDPASPYPNPSSPQLFFKIANPSSNPSSRKKKLAVHRQQLYNRTAKLLGVTDGKQIIVAIHHFARRVIDAFAKDADSPLYFYDYILPSSMVRGAVLGAPFTSVDRFVCLGTKPQDPSCAATGRCACNRFLNVPFVTLEDARACIVVREERRASSALAYSSGRRTAMMEQELAVESQKSSRMKKIAEEAKRDVQEAKKNVEAAKHEMESARKRHQSEAKKETANARKRLQLDFDKRKDAINDAAGKIHSAYARLNGEHQELRIESDHQKTENKRLTAKMKTVMKRLENERRKNKRMKIQIKRDAEDDTTKSLSSDKLTEDEVTSLGL